MPHADPEARAAYEKSYRGPYRLRHSPRIKANASSYYQANRTKRITQMRVLFLKKAYGITEEDYQQMLTNQGGLCGVCKKPQKSGRRLAVDHCHKTKRIRGLLCQSCNSKVEKFEAYLKNDATAETNHPRAD